MAHNYINASLEQLDAEARAEFHDWLSSLDRDERSGGQVTSEGLHKSTDGPGGVSQRAGRKVYGVFAEDGNGRRVWALLRCRRRAVKLAKFYGGWVGSLPLDAARGPWDAPTFRAVCDLEWGQR